MSDETVKTRTPAGPAHPPAPAGLRARTPRALAWRQLRKHRIALIGGVILAALYVLMLFADFVAPYSLDFADRERFYHPPLIPRFIDAGGRVHPQPFVYATELDNAGLRTYRIDPTRTYPVRLFAQGEPHRLLWLIPTTVHLFGVDPPGRIFLLGTDQFGRDLFSRILFGARVSLVIGLLVVSITIPFGMLYGGIAAYYGGRVENVMMRIVEVILGFPAFYLLITLAAVLPNNVACTTRYYLIVVIIAFISWGGLSRLIRGAVLPMKEQEFVLAALAMGMGDLRIIVRHILPNTTSLVVVVATLSIPGSILGESGLSFLGVGVREPCASWGNLLSAGANLSNLINAPWLLCPGLFIIVAVVAYNFLGDGLRDALDPRLRTG
jgi:peptide/nickel transport system permease protein